MFNGLAAGPDPSTMTCPAIIRGFEQNSYSAKYRAKAQHRADAAARVKELEPYYRACKPDAATGGSSELPTAPGAGLPSLPSDVPVMTFGPAPAPGTGPGSGGADAGPGLEIDWKKVAMVAGIGIAGLLILGVLVKKRRSSKGA